MLMHERCTSRALLVYLLATFAVVQMFAVTGTSLAEQIIFTIDPSQSTAYWSGTHYGAPYEPQSPGSLSTPIDGHFLIDFDPLANTPTTMQFIGGHGYYRLASPNVGQPAVGGGLGMAPANVAGQASTVVWAIRNLVWDFSSAPITSANGLFDAHQTSYSVLSGGIDYRRNSVPIPQTWAGASGPITGGAWTLSESSPGSGDWTLSGTPYLDNIPALSGYLKTSGTIVATAHFASPNIAVVAPTDTHADVLGGESAVGGVSATFSQPTTGGTLSVQQVPNETGLSAAAVAAAATNPVFALSTQALSAAPQIWNVDFTGQLSGASATLVFHYDASLLPQGLDESTLGIWHFNSNTSHWDFGGIVDANADTIAFTTNSFSPFELGVTVPEPSSIVLSTFGLIGLAFWFFRGRKSR
jgi:hypothetical protein